MSTSIQRVSNKDGIHSQVEQEPDQDNHLPPRLFDLHDRTEIQTKMATAPSQIEGAASKKSKEPRGRSIQSKADQANGQETFRPTEASKQPGKKKDGSLEKAVRTQGSIDKAKQAERLKIQRKMREAKQKPIRKSSVEVDALAESTTEPLNLQITGAVMKNQSQKKLNAAKKSKSKPKAPEPK